MKMLIVKVFRHEEEAVLLTEHLTRSGIYGIYRPRDKFFELLVREFDFETAINLVENCPMIKDLKSYKDSKLGRAS